jgi:hypothetical protein
MNILRQILFYAIAIAIGVGMYSLYQRQLGSISFLILSIIFFIIGFRMIFKK